MTVHDGMPYLPQAIESVLEQTWTDFEFLIVDDASTDESRQVVGSYRARDPRIRLLVNEENLMQTRSLNRGLAEARGALVARMDADDLSYPERFERQVAFLDAHPDVVAVGVNFRLVDADGRLTGRSWNPSSDVAIRWKQLFRCPIACGSLLFRKTVIWDELGGFNPDIAIAQDWELWSRVPRDHKLANLPDVLLDVRKHAGCETIALDGLARSEQVIINRLNYRRFLAQGAKLDGVTEEDVQSIVDPTPRDPRVLMRVILQYHEAFCEMFANARSDPEVREELTHQLQRVLYNVRLTDGRLVSRALGVTWRHMRKQEWAYHVARWLGASLGLGQLRRRLLSPPRY